jgi:hypothetical protein
MMKIDITLPWMSFCCKHLLNDIKNLKKRRFGDAQPTEIDGTFRTSLTQLGAHSNSQRELTVVAPEFLAELASLGPPISDISFVE